MRRFLRASAHSGGDVPWVWARRHIAARWGVPPPDVDLYPAEEIALELRLIEIEASCTPRPQTG